ncbi:flagellar hook-associated protein 3 FlgL [Geodermatophilus obscurus]|uniref:Flagellar hook-associated protein 3 FlgL n=1 Tax=Geodermatophilus obscurus TaxID=1861 RepID=A0A1I5DLU6_9ACTN|nr:flagellar hook-associated protein FlgL [Geodermatophilus obscurus]SFO00148.1 flagellar hook-associated protein 3 FlgL [Geodermatophilus obscurus]
MRITQRAVAQTALQGLNRNLGELGRTQERLTSGKQISRPSDSPTGVNRAMQVRQDKSAALQQERNISDAKGWLEATDTALTTMLAQVRRVRDLTVQASNEGAMSGTSRAAVATEVAALRDALLGLANQTLDGRPLFGGVTEGSRAYDENGAYVGVGGTAGIPAIAVERRLSNTEVVRIDVAGPEAFGDPADGDDLFALVGRIATDVTADPAALSGHLNALDAGMERLLTAAASVGARAVRVDTASQVNADLQLTLTKQLTAVEDIDLPKTIMQLNMQQTGYQAALSATAKVIQPTLVDFLR